MYKIFCQICKIDNIIYNLSIKKFSLTENWYEKLDGWQYFFMMEIGAKSYKLEFFILM